MVTSVFISVSNWTALDSPGKGRAAGAEEAEEGQREKEPEEASYMEEPVDTDPPDNGNWPDLE